ISGRYQDLSPALMDYVDYTERRGIPSRISNSHSVRISILSHLLDASPRSHSRTFLFHFSKVGRACFETAIPSNLLRAEHLSFAPSGLTFTLKSILTGENLVGTDLVFKGRHSRARAGDPRQEITASERKGIMWSTLKRDLVFSIRTLLKNKSFAVTAVLTL